MPDIKNPKHHEKYPESIIYFGQVIRSRISMKPAFKVERQAMRLLAFEELGNIYLNREKQDLCTLKYSEIFKTFVTQDDQMLKDGEYHFILTCEYSPRLLISQYLHHSSLADGKKVLASGSLFFKDDDLYKISNHSGHYCPTDEEMLDVIKALYVASNGTLKEYYSYCTVEPLVYPVCELSQVESFSMVPPIATNEIIDLVTGERQDCGYDLKIGVRDTRNCYGAGLKADLKASYEAIINSRFGIFAITERVAAISFSSNSHEPVIYPGAI